MTEESGNNQYTVTKREVAAWVLYLLAFGLSIGHQIWLLEAHLTVLVEYKYNPWYQGYIHAIPSYVPVGVFLLAFTVGCFLKPKGSSIWAAAGAGAFAAGTVNTLTYPIQVIVYMCHDVLLFLDALPTYTICKCWPELTLVLLNSVSGDVCECYVPYYGDIKFVKATGSDVTADALGQMGYNSSFPINLTYVTRTGDTWPGESINTWDTSSFKTLNLLLQSCILITIGRLPMYLLLQHLSFRDKYDKVNKGIRQRARQITTSGSVKSGRQVFQRLAKLRVEQVKFESQILREKKMTLHTVIELCYFNFVEGLDAFTLYEDVVEYGDYFKQQAPLTVSLLTFVSITVFLVTTSNVLAMFPNDLDRYNRYTKLLVVIMGNFPFLVIRCYLSYLAGGLSSRGISNIFMMFVVKEVLVLLMGAVEFIMEMYAEDNHAVDPSRDGTTSSKGREHNWSVRTPWNTAPLRDTSNIIQMFFNSRDGTQRENSVIGSLKNNNNNRRDTEISVIEIGTVNKAFEGDADDDVDLTKPEVPTIVVQMCSQKQEKSD